MEVQTYSGQIWHTFSSSLGRAIDLDVACKRLVKSKLFSVALVSNGELYYISKDKLLKNKLQIDLSLGRTGLTVNGYARFIDGEQNLFTLLSFRRALSLLLSQRKAFNFEFGFPCNAAWVFMEPMLISAGQNDRHEVIIPYLTIHSDGTFQITFAPLIGFEDEQAGHIIKNYVNRAHQNIDSVLVSPEFASDAYHEYVSGIPWWRRIAHRAELKELCRKMTSEAESVELDKEISITVTELLHTDKMSLSDVARNIMDRSASISLGSNKFPRKTQSKLGDSLFKSAWLGKPILYIESCNGQAASLADAISENETFIRSVLHRVEGAKWNADLTDHRAFNDYAHFYSPGVTLVFYSAAVSDFLNEQVDSSFDLDNIVCDAQILNEAAQYISMFYHQKLFEVEGLNDAVGVARVKLEVAVFEDRLISSSRQSGEVFNFIDSVLKEPMMESSRQALSNKINTFERAFELSEKSLSDARNRRLSSLFGIIASAALAPVLVSPALNYFGVLEGYSQEAASMIGVAVSILVVTVVAWIASVTAKR
ncbi:hypothetical protein ACP6JA_06760 [Stutzerimonas frequens]